MGRSKKETKIETKVDDITNSTAPTIEPVINPPKIAPLTGGFGRADLDAMRDKINEIIEHIEHI